jgi:hypothetical protein
MATLSNHAARRLRERRLTDEEIAGALAGRAYVQTNGYTLHYDRSSRVAVVINPQAGVLITAYRLKRKQLKRHYSR